MKVRVHFEIADKRIDETVSAGSPDELLATAKARVAKELGWKGMFLSAMSPIQFAQLAVRMYDEHHNSSHEPPQSAADFLTFGRQTGNLELLEE